MQDFSFSSATIHAAFSTTPRGSQHEHKVHELFDLTGYGFSGHTGQIYFNLVENKSVPLFSPFS